MMKNFMLMTRLSVGLGLAAPIAAVADPNPQPTFEQTTPTQFVLDWQGQMGWSYFVQVSTDGMLTWSYLPDVEHGVSHQLYPFSPMATGGGLASKFFVRLRMSDYPVTSAAEALAADFDSDGIPNSFELQTLGSDPLDQASAGGDTDGDGLRDGWERFFFGNLTTANASAILQPDGLTNKEKADLGLDPSRDYSSGSQGASISSTIYHYDLRGWLTSSKSPSTPVTLSHDEEGNLLSAE